MLILKITAPSDSMSGRGLNGLQRTQLAFELTIHREMIIFIALGLSDSGASGLASCVKIQLVRRAKERQRATVGNWRVGTGLEALLLIRPQGVRLAPVSQHRRKLGHVRCWAKDFIAP